MLSYLNDRLLLCCSYGNTIYSVYTFEYVQFASSPTARFYILTQLLQCLGGCEHRN